MRRILDLITCLWPSARGYCSTMPTLRVPVADIGTVGQRSLRRSTKRAVLHATA